MSSKLLKIPKVLMPVRLWVHPEGQVVGALFVKEQAEQDNTAEQPLDILNRASPFVVVRRQEPDELRFYNRASIIRVEYEDVTESMPAEDVTLLRCELQMMDGSVLDGEIREPLPVNFSRLFDYLNLQDNNFIKLHVDSVTVILVNKSYINYARTADRTAEQA